MKPANRAFSVRQGVVDLRGMGIKPHLRKFGLAMDAAQRKPRWVHNGFALNSIKSVKRGVYFGESRFHSSKAF